MTNQKNPTPLPESSLSYAHELLGEAQGRVKATRSILDNADAIDKDSPLYTRVHKAQILITEALVCLESLSKETPNE